MIEHVPEWRRAGVRQGADDAVTDLFAAAAEERLRTQAPLAARLRPRTIDDVVGQDHLVGPGRPLRRLVEQDRLTQRDLLGSARHRQDHAGAGGRRAPPAGPSSSSPR